MAAIAPGHTTRLKCWGSVSGKLVPGALALPAGFFMIRTRQKQNQNYWSILSKFIIRPPFSGIVSKLLVIQEGFYFLFLSLKPLAPIRGFLNDWFTESSIRKKPYLRLSWGEAGLQVAHQSDTQLLLFNYAKEVISELKQANKQAKHKTLPYSK